MNETNTQVTIVALTCADAAAIVELRSALTSAFMESDPRILVDLSSLSEIDGPILAALFIASKEIPASGCFAVLASESVMATIENWSLDTFWECFTDQSLAEERLLACGETGH